MSSEITTTADLVHDLQATLADAAKGVRDFEKMSKAADEMDRMREETRQRVGTIEVAVDLIRAGRDE